MADIFMDVDVALGEVPVNIMPLLDATDFKTIEDAVVFNQAGLALFWNFVTTAGVQTCTAVTPTSGGDYDWTDQGTSGMYAIEIPASGGASINNDTEGFGWFTGVATGILPWRGPIIGFRAAGLNNALIDSAYSATRGLTGTAVPDAAAEAAGGLYTRGTGAGQINQPANGMVDTNPVRLGGTAQSLTDLKDFADTGYDPATHKVQGVVLVDTLTTYTGNTPQTGDSFALANGASGFVAIKTVVDAILVDTGTTLDAKIDAIGVIVTAILQDTGTDIPASIAAVQAVADAIKVVTDQLVAAQAEPTGVPAANATPLLKLARLHQALRNRIDVDSNTGKKQFFDDGGAALWEKDFTDAAGVYSESEGNAP